MNTDGATARSRSLLVGLAGLVIAAALVASLVDAARPDIGAGRDPYISLYAGDRNQIEALLVSGDGQAFAALAQDPLLSRPEVVAGDGEFAYRAQRPVWGYLAWATSFGRGDLAGWALAALSVVGVGFACAVCARLLLARGANPWWGLLVLAAGHESIATLTPEVFALGLFGVGILLWSDDRRAWASVALSAAALTRETMLVGVAALGVWQLAQSTGPLTARARQVTALALPFLAVAAWDTMLRLRLGAWPMGGASESRLAIGGTGLLDSLARDMSPGLVLGVVLAIALCAAAVLLAPRDMLTWIGVAYVLFATTFSREVWIHAGFTRALLPMYVFTFVAALGGLRQRAVAQESRPTRAPAMAAG